MAVRKHLQKQFRLKHLVLQHEDASDFYLSCWQKNRNCLPLLCLRLFLTVGCVGIVLTSILLPERLDLIGYWAIYTTQWALVMLTLSCGLGTVVSAVAYFKGPIEDTLGVPWYVKLYWAAYCISVPIAFYVTVFYYSFLTDSAPEDFEMNPVLDVFSHGVNSVVMFLLMMTSRHPIYLIHFLYPFGFLLVYMIFSIIYYYAGGTNPFGEPAIYPVLHWGEPGVAVTVVFMCAAIIILVHTFTVLLSVLRDYLSRRCRSDHSISNYNISG